MSRLSVSKMRNGILSALPENVLQDLRPHLEYMPLRCQATLHHPNAAIRRVYFVEFGLAMLMKSMTDGRTTMVATIGSEGMTAPNVIFGQDKTDLECVVHVEGAAYSMETDRLRELVDRLPALRGRLTTYGLARADQLAQISACNRLHSLRQRCAGILLSDHENCQGGAFTLTQDFLALTLGAQRPHISNVARSFQAENLIQYKHGRMKVVDAGRLRRIACDCQDLASKKLAAACDSAIEAA